MGLHIGLMKNVKIHQCAGKMKTEQVIERWKRKTEDFYLADSCISEPMLYIKVKFNIYDCPHQGEGEYIKRLNAGYVCSASESNGFFPGEIVEFDDSDGFYYGGYSKWWSDLKNSTCITDNMSDCEGYYSGPHLQVLRDHLKEIKCKSESLKSYYEMLKNIPDDDLISKTIVQHC